MGSSSIPSSGSVVAVSMLKKSMKCRKVADFMVHILLNVCQLFNIIMHGPCTHSCTRTMHEFAIHVVIPGLGCSECCVLALVFVVVVEVARMKGGNFIR